MINKEVDKAFIIAVLNTKFGDTLHLEDILTCYEIACKRQSGIMEGMEFPAVIATTAEKTKVYPNYEAIKEIINDIPLIADNLEAFINPENLHETHTKKYNYDTSNFIEADYTSTIGSLLDEKKIYDKRYGDVVLGRLTYVEYLNENPRLKYRQRVKHLIKTLYGYAGFGRYIPRNKRLVTLNSMIIAQTNPEKLRSLLEKRGLYGQTLIETEQYFNNGCDILNTMTTGYLDELTSYVGNIKIPTLYAYALSILTNMIFFGYTTQQILFTFLRPTNFDQSYFRRSVLSAELKMFSSSSMYMLALNTLEYSRKIVALLESALGSDPDKIDCKYLLEYSYGVLSALEFIQTSVTYNYVEGITEVEELVLKDVAVHVVFAKKCRLYRELKSRLSEDFVGVNKYNTNKITELLREFDNLGNTLYTEEFLRKVEFTDSNSSSTLGQEIVEKIRGHLESIK